MKEVANRTHLFTDSFIHPTPNAYYVPEMVLDARDRGKNDTNMIIIQNIRNKCSEMAWTLATVPSGECQGQLEVCAAVTFRKLGSQQIRDQEG